jgi:peroxiredoxin
MPSTNFMDVDWSNLPAPADDGAARHLPGLSLPDIALSATDGTVVSLATLKGRTVVFAYPMTGRPGVALPDGWDQIPGARGCTPQACAFRDLHADLKAAGANAIYGLSTQDTDYQREVATRVHLPFPLLSDADLALTRAARLPTMVLAEPGKGGVEGKTLIKRLALVIDDGRVTHIFYPVFPPDRNASDVLAWLEANPRGSP